MRLTRVRFTVRRMMFTVASICIIFGGGVATLRWLRDPHITVRVFNETGGTLTGVRITYTVGSRYAGRIVTGGNALWNIRCLGESDIVLTYTDADGHQVLKDDNAYIEYGYRGSLDFHVGRKGVTVENRIQAWPS